MDGETATRKLREAYEAYCDELGEKPLSPSLLGRQLAQRGVARGGSGRRLYRGVSLRGEEK